MNKFQEAQDKLILKAENEAIRHLLAHYGSGKLSKSSKADLSHKEAVLGGFYDFSGRIVCTADIEAANGFHTVEVGMTVNNNDIEVESEKDVQSTIEQALNSATESDSIVTASLADFKLTERENGYLFISHPSFSDAELGKIAKNEYNMSKNKAELLKTVLNDSIARTSSFNTKVAFEGEFKEPVIEIATKEEITSAWGPFGKCKCGHSYFKHSSDDFGVSSCSECNCGYEDTISKPAVKESWLTDTEPPMSGAEFMEYECPVCKECFEDYDLGQHDKSCPGTPEVVHAKPAISISENMPRASMSDHLAQSMQLEDQKVVEANEKIKTEAVNTLVVMLHGLGYGSAKVAEIYMTDKKIDAMITVDDVGVVKAVNIPMEVKADKIVLPKKSLVSELIHKGLDINAKLSEEFGRQVLDRIAAEEARVQYEQDEANSILAEKSTVTKTAGDNGFNSPEFMAAQDSITLQKHLLPEGDWKKGDVVYADNQYWKLSDMESDQNSKGEGDASLYHFVKCEAPKDEDKVKANIKA